MVFNSFSFAIFFAVVLALYRAPMGWSARKTMLLVASYLFYGAWNPPLVSLLFLSTAVDWTAARWMARQTDPRRRKLALLMSLVSNLGMLVVFKYAGFLMGTFEDLLGAFGASWTAPAWDLVLPVGISFYTFQTLSFTIDVYRGNLDPQRTTLLDFALFVAFFPQLVAGPIVRAADFLPQLRAPKHTTSRGLVWGVALITLGLFEKSVLADALLARHADAAFAAAAPSTADAWIGALAFSGQIFFDFAGYSTCAIGVAMALGFALPDNFRTPYGASGFSDFWRRWHISLSSWLRDYLYISLGGNRKGPSRTTINLFLTMLLGGLWHGASWNFVLWGALHGAYLVAERLVRGRDGREGDARGLRLVRAWFVTQLAVLLAWVPFRAVGLDGLTAMLGGMFTWRTTESAAIGGGGRALVLGLVLGTYLVQLLVRRHRLEALGARVGWRGVAFLVGIAWIAIWIAQPPDRAFIYFQF